MTAYEIAQEALTDVLAIETKIMPIVDPGMAPLITDALQTIKNILSNTWGDKEITPAEIDQAARTALDAKFSK